ncbi:MAG: flippase-like domain-containing protein, partial [Ktedonobacteraceae bacterium]|nr:flippase-like domain-containing protein [Ktedonobacteraceae bacterium]
LLALAFLGFLLQELSYGFIWRAVLSRLDVHLNLRTCLRVYLASEFVRYIPGNVWHVLTRILWIGKYGVSRPVAFASMTIELITKLAAGALVFAVSLFFWQDYGAVGRLLHGTPVIIGLGGGSMLALLVGLHPRILNGLLNVALRLLRREPVRLALRYSDILLITLSWCASWVIAGGAFYLLLLALWPAAPLALLPLCIGIYALVWDIGFVSFITPSGLGVREGAMVILWNIAFALPGGLAAVLAILSRLVSTVAELLCVGLAYLGGEQQIRAVQREQLAQSLASGHETPAGTEERARHEAAASISIEGEIK